MVEPFLNRTIELQTLKEAWREPGANLVLVWGRRRAGKTRLLGEFAAGKRAVFYGATQQSSAAELVGLSESARRALQPSGTDLLALGDFTSWDVALDYLAEQAADKRLLVVLDEFPYLIGSEPALPSLIQRFWDHRARDTRLMLVLCGSAQSAMLDLQAASAPLYGRIDRRLQVRPFAYREAALFTPGLSPAELASVYGTLGGMPVYLSRWRTGQGRDANVRRLFGDASSPLVEEGEFVLTSELPEAAGYFRILHGIATGHRTFNALREFAAMDIKRQLDRLLELGLVLREVPATEDPARSKRVIYRIGDNFLDFWFRFVFRRRADIARGLGREVVDRMILPRLNDHMGEIWEEMCRDFVRRRAAQGALPVPVSSVGRWWNRDKSVEVDVVGLDGRKVVLAGSVKWSRTAGRAELRRLQAAVEALPDRAEHVQLVLFARERVRDVEPAEALAFTAADLYEGL